MRGIKGEVAISPSPETDSYIPKSGETVEVKSKKYQHQLVIDYFKEISGAFVVKFKGTDCFNDAFKLVGYSISSFAELTEDSTTVLEYVVIDTQGNTWGTVIDLESAGLNQLLEIETPENESIYVPFADGIVKSIDNDKKIILIDPPQGLRDLNS